MSNTATCPRSTRATLSDTPLSTVASCQQQTPVTLPDVPLLAIASYPQSALTPPNLQTLSHSLLPTANPDHSFRHKMCPLPPPAHGQPQPFLLTQEHVHHLLKPKDNPINSSLYTLVHHSQSQSFLPVLTCPPPLPAHSHSLSKHVKQHLTHYQWFKSRPCFFACV